MYIICEQQRATWLQVITISMQTISNICIDRFKCCVRIYSDIRLFQWLSTRSSIPLLFALFVNDLEEYLIGQGTTQQAQLR